MKPPNLGVHPDHDVFFMDRVITELVRGKGSKFIKELHAANDIYPNEYRRIAVASVITSYSRKLPSVTKKIEKLYSRKLTGKRRKYYVNRCTQYLKKIYLV